MAEKIFLPLWAILALSVLLAAREYFASQRDNAVRDLFKMYLSSSDPESLRNTATSVLSYWDYMDAVPGNDERPAAEFKDEMDRRMDALRMALDIPESPVAEER